MVYKAKTLMVMGDNVRAIRQRNRMSVSELAGRVDVCDNTIHRIEKNQLAHGGSIDIWLSLCNEFGCTLDDLTKDWMQCPKRDA